jgi:hypothetical protein
MKKYGVISVQFNLFFILIAGLIIILIFSGFAIKQNSNFEKKKNLMALQEMDHAFAIAKSSNGGVFISPKLLGRIEFRCDQMISGKFSKNLGSMMGFYPSSIISSPIIVAMKSDIKFNLGNTMYLGDSKVRYIFIGNSELARDVFEKFPLSNKDGFTSSEVINSPEYWKVRLIFLNSIPEIPNRFKGEVTILSVNGDLKSGQVNFLEYRDGKLLDKGNSEYFSYNGLLGAIFSDNIENYNCGMDQFLYEIKLHNAVIKKRLDLIKNLYDANSICGEIYSRQEILDAIDTLSDDDQDFENLGSALGTLESANKLAEKNSCASIY